MVGNNWGSEQCPTKVVAEKRNLYWRFGNNGGGNHGAAPSHLSLIIGDHVAIIVSCYHWKY